MVIDPTTALGKVRLRIGDWSDIPILPDEVIQNALTECQQNLPRASALCAQYILATLTAKTHKRMSQVEVWSAEQFDNYVKFLQMTILNPHMMAVAPVPYVGSAFEEHPIQVFMDDWKAGYQSGAVVVTKTTYAPVIENEPS